ncbi:MAG: ankyrin repeat domain-containing protein [Spirochaetaceae bacterium]|nr:MAG: ankyrin repeat domain-containing protein [Spirochaetaceae bacterium]
MIRSRKGRDGQSGPQVKILRPAALLWVFLLCILLNLSGCFSQPAPSDSTKSETSTGPELPETYETEVRGINRKLIQASFAGKAADVQVLFADEDSKNLEQEYINTSLHLASVRGSTDTVRILLDNGADVNSTTARGGTALMWAAGSSMKPSDTVRVLLQAGADVHVRSENGRTALIDAAARGNGEIAEILLVAGAEVNGIDEQGITALMMAAAHGHLDCVSTLLKYGASKYAIDLLGQTALDKARDANQAEVIGLLAGEGAER